MKFKKGETNESLSTDFLLPVGKYGVAILPKWKRGEKVDMLSFVEDDGDFSSLYFRAQMILLGDEDFNTILGTENFDGKDIPLSGWTEDVFITLVSKAGDSVRMGIANFSKFLNYAGCVGDGFNISDPQRLYESLEEKFEKDPVFVVIKISHWNDTKNSRIRLNMDFIGPCNNKERASGMYRAFASEEAEEEIPF